MKSSQETYRRLLTKIAADIAKLRPDEEKLRERLNIKFKKYLQKAGVENKNGPTGNQNN